LTLSRGGKKTAYDNYLEVLTIVTTASQWDVRDLERLQAIPEQDLFDWFMHEQGPRFLEMIRELLRRTYGTQGLHEKVKRVLDRIADNGGVNQIRVREFIGYKRDTISDHNETLHDL
jgi:hypothetical protein